MSKLSPREVRDLLQYTFLRDERTMLAFDELLRVLCFWIEPQEGKELILHNFAVWLVSVMGLYRSETTLDVLKAMKAKALEIQAAEPLEDKDKK